MSKPVAIILLNWNTPQHTLSCITSLKAYCNAYLFDIILADNGSTDNSLAIIASEYPDLIFIDNQSNLGFAAGNNKALAYSIAHDYTYSLLLNTDTEVDEDIVTQLTYHLNQHANAAAVQPAIYWLHNKQKIWNGKGRFDRHLGLIRSDTQTPYPNDIKTFKIADWLTGCCMFIRNSALIKSGLFNERFFLYYEDVDLSFRLRRAGFQLHYLPSCKMYHEAGVSAKKGPTKREGNLNPIIHYYVSRNNLWILRLYGSPIFYPIYMIRNGFYYLALLLYFIVRGRIRKAKMLLKGIKDGLWSPPNDI